MLMSARPANISLYVRMFLFSWPIATAIWFALGLLTGRPVGSILVTAAGLGAVCSAVLTMALIRPFGPLQGDAQVRAVTSLVLSTPFDAAFDRCSQAARSLPGSSVKDINRASGIIKARVARSPASWGERLEVTLRPIGTVTEVTVSSKPAFRPTVLDQGKNRRNVESIVAAVRDR
jgi:hypothetical protein